MKLRSLAAVCALAAACSPSGISAPLDGGADGAAACTPAAARPGTVVTDSGAVTGTLAGASYIYRGVPYAAPPIGPLRFRPPAPPACWSGERATTSFAAECPQFSGSSAGGVGTGAIAGDEDCLYLNVWAPSAPPPAPLPVMVFIHGGGNVEGAGSLPSYDGQYLSEHGGAVVVTINYRLGTLGFLVHPALEAESAEHVSGNYGILDQIAALAWVRRNIGGFGGDPARVMIFGESAGAVDVCVLMASPLAKGLFARALMESGGCYQQPMAAEEPMGAQLASAAGCGGASDVAACLRALDAKTILQALPPTGNAIVSGLAAFKPNVDGYVLLESPILALGDGSAAHVPMIVGANGDETGKAAAALQPPIASDAAYQAAVDKQFGAYASAVLAQYPSSSFASPEQAYVAVTTDARFVCPARQTLRAAQAGAPEVAERRYFFTHAVENAGPAIRAQGAWHGEELLFVFHTFGAAAGYVPTAAESALSDAMVGYWSRFAAGGDPDGAGAAAWPAFTAAGDEYLGLDDTIAAGAGVRTARCDFWDGLAGMP